MSETIYDYWNADSQNRTLYRGISNMYMPDAKKGHVFDK